MPWIGGDAPLTRVVTGWDSVPVDVQLSKAIPVFTTWATRLCQLMMSCFSTRRSSAFPQAGEP